MHVVLVVGVVEIGSDTAEVKATDANSSEKEDEV